MRLKRKGQLTEQLLSVIGSGPSRTATEIANGIEHSPATVSGILARLVKQGRIKRFTAQQLGRTDHQPSTWLY